MARIRSVKPVWWRSAKWCALPRDIRFTYKGMWEVMADDEGRFEADPRQVKAEIWPLDDDITPKRIAMWMAQIATVLITPKEGGPRIPALILYDVGGVQYGFLPGFIKHQKISNPTPSKLPNPPERFAKIPQKMSKEEEEEGKGEEGKGREKEEEGEAAPPPPPGISSLDALLDAVPNRTVWQAEIDAMLDGMAGHVNATRAEIEQAATDYLGNGASKTLEPNLRQFRRYVEGAKAQTNPGRRGAPTRKQSTYTPTEKIAWSK